MEQLGLPAGVSHELLDVPDRLLGDRGGGAGDGLLLDAELPAKKLLLEEREYRQCMQGYKLDHTCRETN